MKILLVLVAFFVSGNVMSQNDSLDYKLKLTHLIAPAVCIGVGVISVGSDWMDYQNHEIRDELQENIDSKISIDDYTQYVPALAVYGLNLCGLKGRSNFKDRTMILAMSWLTMGIITNSMKYTFKEMRPDGSSRNSFPSGHTAMAFMGEEFLFQEYKDVSPWIGVAGYAMAAGTGFFRMYNNRHWLNDIIAGAGIGILSTKLSYWLYPKIFKRSHHQDKPHDTQFVAMPYYDGNNIGCSAVVNF